MKKKSYIKIFHKIDFLDGLMDSLLIILGKDFVKKKDQ
jgi:hypothetical protein